MKINYLDLFSGCGGFALGLQMAGIEFNKHYYSEVDEYAEKVYKKHFPGAVGLGDITRVQGRGLPAIGILTGGFPCQGFSVAGKQRGKEDDRYLWPEMYRVIKETKPRWVIGENVTGIINLALDTVLSDLESEGYEVQTFIIPACAVDAPHRRDRVWIIANRKCLGWHERSSKRIQPEKRQSERQESKYIRKSISKKRNVGYSQSNRDSEFRSTHKGANKTRKGGAIISNISSNDELQPDMADTDSARWIKQCGTESVQKEYSSSECRSRWLPEPPICRVAHGIPNRVDRLKCLGNAIVPQIVAIIGHYIMEVERLYK